MRRITHLLALAVGIGLIVTLAPSTARASQPPSVLLSPRTGPPTTKTTATGVGFAPGEEIDLTAGSRPIAEGKADAQGSFTYSGVVPKGARPGRYEITATGESSGLQASSAFYVNTNWPQAGFDSARTGYNPYENVLDSSNVANLTAVWTDYPVYQYSAPIVVNGVVYVTGYGPPDDSLIAIDARTGADLWVATMGGEYDGTGSTPATANGVVYASDLGGLHAFDAASGTPLWTFSDCGSVWGEGIDLTGGVVYVSGTSGLCAVQAASGAQLWRFTAGDWDFGPLAVANGVVYTSGDFSGAYAVDAKTGRELWRRGGTAQFITSTPVVGNGLVYFSSQSDARLPGDPSLLVALRTSDGTPAWTDQMPQPPGFTGGMTLAGGTSYVPTTGGLLYNNSDLYAFDASTGKPLWTSPVSGYPSGPSVANGVVYVGGESSIRQAILSALDPATGRILWQVTDPDAGIFEAPTVANGVVYGSTGLSLWAYRLPKG